MALSRIFGGTNIFIPGAYDTKNVTLTGAAPSIAVGKVAIFGESSKGRPGATEILQFSPEALRDLINEYGDGPLTDAARALVIPSNDSRITNGASAIYVYKTNNSTQSTLSLATTWGKVDSKEFGQEANLISVEIQKNNATNATTVSSAAFDETTISATGTFSLRQNGGAINTFSFSGAPTNNANLQTQLDNAGNWSGGLPSETTFTVSGSDGASLLTISTDALSTDHRLDAGRGFELDEGTNTPLATMNLSEGFQQASLEPTIRYITQRQSDGSNEDTDDGVGDLGGNVILNLGYQGTTATLTINTTNFTTTVTGGSGSSLNLTVTDFTTINDLAAFVNAQTGYTATVEASANGGLNPNTLGLVSAVGFASSGTGETPGKIKSDAFALFDYVFKNSSLVDIPNTGSRVGFPDPISQTFLANGTRGSSASSDFTSGLVAFEGIEDIDLLLPCVSQDASDDIAEDSSITDSSSAYDIESVHLATKNHCKLMSSTKNRRERACYLGFRGTLAESKTQSRSLNSEFASFLIQDVQVLGSDGNLTFRQPHVSAALAAGMQAGGDIGEPTTKKLINAAAIKHVKKQGITPSTSEKFDPKTKSDEAIEAGIFPLNDPSSGGVEIRVQNATYSKDSNFVFNRPSVFSAVNFVAKTMRLSLENKFVGTKNRTGTRDAVKAEVEALMADFLRSDIIVGDDTNGQLGFKALNVRPDGNAVLIDITITPVQGIDFVLTDINIDNIRNAA